VTSVLRVAAAAALTVLGVGVAAAQSLAGVVSRLLPPGDAPPEPHHNTNRVREQVKAAQRAARDAGVLKR